MHKSRIFKHDRQWYISFDCCPRLWTHMPLCAVSFKDALELVDLHNKLVAHG